MSSRDPWSDVPNLSGMHASTLEESRAGDPSRFFPSAAAGVIDPVTGRILNVPKAGGYCTTALGMVNGTWTSIPWDVKQYDTDGMWDPTVPDRVTCITPGLYLFCGDLGFSAYAPGYRQSAYWVNGTNLYSNTIFYDRDAVSVNMATSAMIALKAGDYVEFRGVQVSGINLTLTPTGGAITFNAAWSCCMISTFGSDNQ